MSNHKSLDGFNVTVPLNRTISYGLTNSVVEALFISTKASSVYGNVIKSPVF